MLYNGAVLSIAQSASGEFYGEYEEGATVTLYRQETLVLLDTLKSQAAALDGAEWEATLPRLGWLSPVEARELRQRAERAEQRLAELLTPAASMKRSRTPVRDSMAEMSQQATASTLLPRMPRPAHCKE